MAESTQTGTNLSRRSLLGGAITLGGGAAISAAVSMPGAMAAPAIVVPKKFHPIVASSSKNIVETTEGKIYGFSRDGVIGYRGIPYGASTEGANRFMPPQKAKPWAGVRSALYHGWVCPQPYNSTRSGRRVGWTHDDEAFMCEWDDGAPSEDCLRLNVWTQGLDNKKRAVMVWIHGGGMFSGSSNEMRSYDGENLARQEDVVVVSINHRLGPLGFLNLMEFGEQYASSPNVSMLDIIASLQWVKENIANFGGDPNRVMIFGQSGGGRKVSTIMGMPGAKGLFQRAAVQSGSALRQGSTDESIKLSHLLLAELGVTRDTLSKLHTDFNFYDIHEASLIAEKKLPAAPGGSWGAVVDGKLIPRHTWDPTAPEFSAEVPMIVGNVLNEFANALQMGEPTAEDWDMAEAKKRLSRVTGEHTDHLFDVVKKLHPTASPFEQYSRIFAMRSYRINAIKQAQLKTKQGVAPAYLYWFQWQSQMCDGRGRAFHTVDIPFAFHNADLCAKITGNTPSTHKLAEQMAGAWATFAKTGNPNHPGIPKWEPYNDKLPTMIWNTETTTAYDPDAELRVAVAETMA